ncbi:MAG: hypothetical protein ACHQF0_03265 [Chitinophagales bacterium]
MEVHHHPHVEKKRFKEYFLEFIMIFLAVSLGFIAENIRESLVNKENEKHYMQNLVSDLRADTANLNYCMYYQGLEYDMLDSALNIPIGQLAHVNTQDTFFHYIFLYYSLVPTFAQSNNTISQLKAGGFNIISNKSVIDSINFLYQKYDLVEFALKYDETNYWDVAHTVQSMMRLPKPAVFWDDPSINAVPRDKEIFLTKDNREIERLYNVLGNSTGSFKTAMKDEEETKTEAIRLIAYLEEQYHIK